MTSDLLKKGLIGGMVIAIGGSTLGGSLSVATATTHFSYAIEDLGTLGGYRSYAYGINNLGQVVGSSQISTTYAYHAVLWDKGNKLDLGILNGDVSSHASGINNAGQVVGASESYILCGPFWSYCPPRVTHAVLWDKGNKIDLGILNGGTYSSANAINNAEKVVGSSQTSSSAAHAVLWENGNKLDLGTLGGTDSSANAINNASKIVGYSKTSSGASHAVLWDNGNKLDLGTLGGTDSSASAINNAGKVVGSSQTSSGATHAVLWNHGNKIDLGTLGGTDSSANAINNAGKIVGYSKISSGASHAVLWDKGSIKDLNNLLSPNSGWELNVATGINDRGQIVGTGTINGLERAFLLTPIRVTQ